MDNCECGHEPSSHDDLTGACQYDCYCPRYSRDDYDDDAA